MYDSIIRLSLFPCVFYPYIQLRIIHPKILWNKKYWKIWKISGFETSSQVFWFKNFVLNSHIAYSNVHAYCTYDWDISSLCTRKPKNLGLPANLNPLESLYKISPPDSYFQAYTGPWNISSIPSWNIFILKNSWSYFWAGGLNLFRWDKKKWNI